MQQQLQKLNKLVNESQIAIELWFNSLLVIVETYPWVYLMWFQLVGVSQGCLDSTVPYLLERQQFGKPIFEFQVVCFLLVWFIQLAVYDIMITSSMCSCKKAGPVVHWCGSGLLHSVLPYMPIRFWDCKELLVMNWTHVRSTIAKTRPLSLHWNVCK